MIKHTPWVAFFATALLLGACQQAEEPAPQGTATAVTGQVPPAAQPAGPAAEPQLTEADKELITEIGALQTKVDELQQQAAHKTAETQSSLVQQLNALQHEREDLKDKVDDLSDTGAAVAANVLNGLNQSLGILTRSVEMEPEEELSTLDATNPAEGQKP